MQSIHNPKCYARHTGNWLVEPRWFNTAVASVRAGTWPMVAMDGKGDDERQDRPPYRVMNGVAVIDMSGPLTKGWSKFGGTSTVAVRHALRKASTDRQVRSVLLHIDSPGGSVDGTDELAAEVRRTDIFKPVVAHCEDMVASAALWVAVSARQITATPMTRVGSIGCVAVVQDTSGAAEMQGIKVHVIATGQFKGAFADGAPVKAEHLAYLQAEVNEIGERFINAVATGRMMSPAAVRRIADGRCWGAEQAVGLGLIDKVMRMDAAMANAVNLGMPKPGLSALTRRVRLAEIGVTTPRIGGVGRVSTR